MPPDAGSFCVGDQRHTTRSEWTSPVVSCLTGTSYTNFSRCIGVPFYCGAFAMAQSNAFITSAWVVMSLSLNEVTEAKW